jgi:hypothetical protein
VAAVTDQPDDPYRQGSGGEPPAGSPPPYGNPPYEPQQPQQPQQPAYGAAPPYGAPPYGAPPYGAPQYGAPPYGYQQQTPEQGSLRTQAIVALVANAVVLAFTCFMALPSIGGVITAGIAIGQVNSDVANARRLVRWSWGLLIATIVLGVLIFGGLIALGAAVDSAPGPTTGY